MVSIGSKGSNTPVVGYYSLTFGGSSSVKPKRKGNAACADREVGDCYVIIDSVERIGSVGVSKSVGSGGSSVNGTIVPIS